MKYRNPPLAEVQQHSGEGREFLLLLGGAAVIVALLVGALVLFSDWIAPRIPFPVEQALARSVTGRLEGGAKAVTGPAEAALGQLAKRVADQMDLPAGMTITTHLVDSPVVNAMATLGGHVFVYRGLLRQLGSEDALAAVLAHEIGHVRERHVIRGLGRGVVMVAGLSAIGVKNQGLTQWALGKGAELGALSFSREAEREADARALEAVHRLYGHVGGIAELFALFSRIGGGGVEILRTHPLSENRLTDLSGRAATRGYAMGGAMQPMPPALETFAVSDGPRNKPAAGRDSPSD